MASSSPSGVVSERSLTAPTETGVDADPSTDSRAISSGDHDESESPHARILPSIEQDETTTHSTRSPSKGLDKGNSKLASTPNLRQETIGGGGLSDRSEESSRPLQGFGPPSGSRVEEMSAADTYAANISRGLTVGSSDKFDVSDSLSKSFGSPKSTIKSDGQTLREVRVSRPSVGGAELGQSGPASNLLTPQGAKSNGSTSIELGQNSSDSSFYESGTIVVHPRLMPLAEAARVPRTRNTLSRQERRYILEKRKNRERIFRQNDARRSYTARQITGNSGFANLLPASNAHRRRQRSRRRGHSVFSSISRQSNLRNLRTSHPRFNRRNIMVMQQSSTEYRAKRRARPHYGDITGTGPSHFDYNERASTYSSGHLTQAYGEGDTTDEERTQRIPSYLRRLRIDGSDNSGRHSESHQHASLRASTIPGTDSERKHTLVKESTGSIAT
ncbi:hypothetical protein BKA64DRAFT_641955 [Cadophora sp. MPI-SDFR-AT-0126]|nr:hypothetical protein BKA64DRAFT_641955 [Leotiomycetes sp. MPI-SDFR-AT-0126]